jgi:hypothetical protein
MVHSALVTELACTPATAANANQRQRLTELSTFVGLALMAQVKFFDDGLALNDADNYYMEREWRLIGRFLFAREDLTHIVAPRSYASRLRADFPDLRRLVHVVDD